MDLSTKKRLKWRIGTNSLRIGTKRLTPRHSNFAASDPGIPPQHKNKMKDNCKRLSLLSGAGAWFLLCLTGLQACDDQDGSSYQPLPKMHLEETFSYHCTPENYLQMEYDTLGNAAVLNFHKEEITSLDHVDYDEQTCTFSFHKGETAKYRISWDYQSDLNVVHFLYGQNGMWHRMTYSGDSYILEANDGMTLRAVVYRTLEDSIRLTMNRFSIEECDDP